MNKPNFYIKPLLMGCVFTFLTTSVSNAQIKETGPSSSYEYEVLKLLDSLRDITHVPGISVSVVHKGKQVAAVSSGYVDLEKVKPVNQDSIFRLASVSKIIGATMLGELVISGKLDPDKTIKHYLPSIGNKYQALTIRQLLSHTSGMPHYQLKDYDIYDVHYDSAVEALTTLKHRDLLSTPGSKYEYSTHGYTLAGAIYESVTGEPLSKGLPKFIERWTGKQTPIIEDIRRLSNDTSALFTYSNNRIVSEPFGEKSYSVFGAGLSATASDLAYLGYEVLRQTNDAPALKNLLFTPTLDNNNEEVATNRFKVGFGWRIGKDNQGKRVFHHAGSTPGARSILVIYPDSDLSIAVLSNISWVAAIDKMAFSLANLYMDGASAKALDNKTEYTSQYENSHSRGYINCAADICYLVDEHTSFTDWLNGFNLKSDVVNDWPIYLYETETGRRLLMVNKVGIHTLIEDKGVFKLPMGKNKLYSITLK